MVDSSGLLIYEASSGGHFLVFVRHLVEGARTRGRRPLIAITAAVRASEEFETKLAPVVRDQDLLVLESPLSAAELPEFAAALGVDQVVVPNGDSFAYWVGWKRVAPSVKTTALVLADPYLQPLSAKVALKRWLLRRSVGVCGLRVRRLGSARLEGRLDDVTPDPVLVDMTGSAEDVLGEVRGWSAGYKIFLMVGVIQEWKNPALVVRAFRAAELEDAVLLIAGPHSGSVRDVVLAEMGTTGGRVMCLDRLLSDDEINALIRESFAVVLAYSTHAPNSTAAKAAALGVRVVAAGSRQFVRNMLEIGLNPSVGRLEVGSLAEAMRRAMVSRAQDKVPLASVDDFVSSLLD